MHTRIRNGVQEFMAKCPCDDHQPGIQCFTDARLFGHFREFVDHRVLCLILRSFFVLFYGVRSPANISCVFVYYLWSTLGCSCVDLCITLSYKSYAKLKTLYD